MKLDTLIWSEIKITHIAPPKRKGVKYEEAIWQDSTLRVMNNILFIHEYVSAQGVYTGKSLILANPQLINLQPWCAIFEAEWVEATNSGTKKEKTYRHKVCVSAKF